MTKYYFDITDGSRLVDASGLDCRDDQDAQAKAKIIAKKVSEETLRLSSRATSRCWMRTARRC
jgi:hypothetical protein